MMSTDKTNFPHNLFLTNRKVVSLSKTFENSFSKDVEVSKTQLSKIIQSGGFLDRMYWFLWPKVCCYH